MIRKRIPDNFRLTQLKDNQNFNDSFDYSQKPFRFRWRRFLIGVVIVIVLIIAVLVIFNQAGWFDSLDRPVLEPIVAGEAGDRASVDQEVVLSQMEQYIEMINMILTEDWETLNTYLVGQEIEIPTEDFETMQTEMISILETEIDLDLTPGRALTEDQKEMIRQFTLSSFEDILP